MKKLKLTEMSKEQIKEIKGGAANKQQHIDNCWCDDIPGSEVVFDTNDIRPRPST